MNEELTTLQARLRLSDAGMAAYLGVPLPTWRKWRAGERQAPAVAVRLVRVLGLVEVLLPGLHSELLGGGQ